MAYYNDNPFGQGTGASRVDGSLFATPTAPGLGPEYYNTVGGGRPGYQAFTNAFAGTGNSRFANFLNGRFDRYNNEYTAQAATNPSQGWSDWLLGNQDRFAKDFRDQNPVDKGQMYSRPMRWL